MFQINSHFMVFDVIHVCCHSYLWCSVRHPMLGVIVFSILFPWVIIIIYVNFIVLNCVIKFKITYRKTREETSWKKSHFLTYLNAWGHLLSDVKIYDDPGVWTFILDRVPIETLFYTCVVKAESNASGSARGLSHVKRTLYMNAIKAIMYS